MYNAYPFDHSMMNLDFIKTGILIDTDKLDLLNETLKVFHSQ